MAVEVLSDMLTSSLLDPIEFENERGVILEELAMADDDPSDVASERFFEAVLGDHPLGRPIGGSPETIQAATRESVWEHYRANYRAQDLVITVAGAVDHDVLVAGVQRALAAAGWDLSVEAAARARAATRATGLIERGSPLVVVKRPIEQANILLGVPGIAATDDRRSTMAVLNSILGGGMSSRLFQEIREKRGLAYSVYSFSPSYSDAGLFGLYAGCSPAKAGQVAELHARGVPQARGWRGHRRGDAPGRGAAERGIRPGPRGLGHPDVAAGPLRDHPGRVHRPRRGPAPARAGHGRRRP